MKYCEKVREKSYLQLPDAYKVAINGNHPVVDKVLKAETEEEKTKLAKQAFDLRSFLKAY